MAETETEATLVVYADNPQDVVARIASLRTVAQYILAQPSAVDMLDVYFDTPERGLQDRELALRIREADGRQWITLKGPSHRIGNGIDVRLEIEQPWSPAALARVIQEVERRGARLSPASGLPATNPVEQMQKLGLEVIQIRQTQRQVRYAVRPNGERDEVVAELAIDAVTYRFAERAVRHYEVEIEAKGAGGVQEIKVMAESLRRRFRPHLRPWKHGKLATGRAIQDLLKEETPGGLVAESGALTRAAYDRIDAYLKREGALRTRLKL